LLSIRGSAMNISIFQTPSRSSRTRRNTNRMRRAARSPHAPLFYSIGGPVMIATHSCVREAPRQRTVRPVVRTPRQTTTSPAFAAPDRGSSSPWTRAKSLRLSLPIAVFGHTIGCSGHPMALILLGTRMFCDESCKTKMLCARWRARHECRDAVLTSTQSWAACHAKGNNHSH
jgi:hypothetical protein